MILRRKRLPPELKERFEGFRAAVEPLEEAKAALPPAVPTTRLPGRPLAEVLLEYEVGLDRTAERMNAWRAPEVQGEWDACWAGLREARAMAERLRTQAPDLGGFEGLIGVLGDLLAPLEAFEIAAERFRSLRR
ncbi:MAG TPA: hypothetical protein VE646_13640 [Actinomycetota bacterium]|jgi:hypothetical protein|nr:hypothetical protein [Actinomycetota bacterium]